MKKIINEKEEQIKGINVKIRENEVKIRVLQIKSKEKDKVNNNSKEKMKEKKLNVDEQLKEFGYNQNIKTKNEKIEKLSLIINHLKEELNKNYIAKEKEKELEKIQNELQIEGIIDVKNILSNETKMFEQYRLSIIKNEIELFIKGNKVNDKEKEINSVKILKNIGKDNKKLNSHYNTYKKSSYSLNRKKNNINNNVISFSLQKGKK